MLTIPPSVRVFLAPGATDLRQSFEGLASATTQILKEDPLSGHLFVFCNRGRNRIRILLWDGSGYWVLMKRLEKGTFAWPSREEGKTSISFRGDELSLLLAGIDLSRTHPRPWYRRSAPLTSSVEGSRIATTATSRSIAVR